MARQTLSCCVSETTEMRCDIFNVVVVYAVADHLSLPVYRRLASLLRSEYGPRLQSVLQGRGIYSTGEAELQVEWSIWDWRTIDDEAVIWRCQKECGHVFLVITDSSSVDAGQELEQEILDSRKNTDVPVMVSVLRDLSDSQEGLQNLSVALHRFCHYFTHSAGFVVPPKKAMKCMKCCKMALLARNIRQFFKRNKRGGI